MRHPDKTVPIGTLKTLKSGFRIVFMSKKAFRGDSILRIGQILCPDEELRQAM